MSIVLSKSAMENLLNQTSENVSYLRSLVDSMAVAYTKDLDTIMQNVQKDVVQVEEPPINVMENYMLELTNAIYFLGSKLDTVGMYDTMSKAALKEAYNAAYLGNQLKDAEKKNKTTVAENTAVAEQSTVNESAVNTVYNVVYQCLKSKLQNAQLMVSSLSKAISRRMSEMSLSGGYVPGGKRQLNEGWQDQGY